MDLDHDYCFEWCNTNRKTCSCGYVNGRCDYEASPAPHYAAMRCTNCGKHQGFIPSPEGSKRTRPTRHSKLVKKIGLKHCQMCLRNKSDLAKPDHLQAHHVDEFAKGGSNDPSNIWIVCSACHSLIHWARTYVGRGGNA